MSYLVLYTKGARIWMPDPEKVWKGAEVVEDYDGKTLSIEYEDGQKQTLNISDPGKLPPLRNPEILVGENDLTSLSYLHEPAVLHNLKVRFCDHNAIYTYCGIVLVAINPYEELPIYGNDTIMAYRGQSMGDLDPHIFAVAEEAYTKVERENEDQSIIVSGESGAGKTVSAKYAMRYFATVGGSTTETQVEKKVLASNPIMEAIGNAKTTRNDNSSRFGKYIEIDFNNHFHIIGANMRTYLLEKSRVVFQAPDERNYHIFYQLVASADQEELRELQLGDQSNYHYINQGDSPRIPGVDDAQYFVETRNAFTLLGFPEKQQLMIFKIFASILHLGNVDISPGADGESCFIVEKDPHLLLVCELLGIDYEQMRTWLCFRKIQSMREVIAKPMTPDQAVLTRDALSKHIYSKLFDWIVTHINKSLASSTKAHRFIGVLDIYGFETFEINSFEQFCINYANEKLQQQFNMHVFKLEQEEYVREQIEWKFIDFYDNQPCIDLIESKLGILDLLDEECRMPKGTDDTWCHKLYEKCKKSKHFEKPRLSNSAFIIRHFADNVQYEAAGFLEKNRDTIMEEHINILKASHFELVAELFEDPVEDKKLKPVAQIRSAKPQAMKSQKQHKKTVGSQFRDSLGLLMTTLNSTTPHYIRCIKPNDQKDSFSFDPKRAVQQLRACGVLETIRISAAGFPSRWSYQDFLQRYRVLTKSKEINRKDIRTTCQKILTNVIKEEDKFQFGKTKIFFRAGQVAYLEKLRSDKLRACVLMVQKHIRGWLIRSRYVKLRNSTIIFQRYIRGYLARRKAHDLKCKKAATIIQRNVRKFVCQRKYSRLRHTAIGIQALARGMWARQRYQKMRENAAATIIQKHVRGWLVRRRCAKTRNQIITAQSAVRRWLAKKQFKKLKIEARSVEHMKKLNKGLENKIISLQQKLEEVIKENKHYKSREEDFKELTAKLEQMRTLENDLKMSSNKILELEQKLLQITAENGKIKEENQIHISEKDLLKSEKDLLKSEKDKINTHNAQLQENLLHMQELLKANAKEVEDMIKNRLENEKRLILSEFDAERAAYQKLLKENARLEQRFENLQSEFSRVRGLSPGHNRTPSNISLISFRSDATELARDDASDFQDEDTGYGSIRVKDRDTNQLKLDTVNWDQSTPASKEPSPGDDEKRYEGEEGHRSPDVAQLQRKVQALEAENNRLKANSQATKHELQRRESNAQHMMRLQELEQENVKLKTELKKMRESIVSADKTDQTKALLDQFENIQEELERRREECIQLRSILANQSQDLKSITQEAYGGNIDIINEDGELLMAFETQKKLIRQLEMELQAEQLRNNEIRHEMKKLQEDNERQQKLLSQNLKKSPQAQQDAILQHEVNRLTSENVDLKEKVDNLQDQLKKLKNQLKAIYAKKKKKDNAGVSTKQPAAGTLGLEPSPDADTKAENGDKPLVKHKEVEYMGMFEYKKEDEPVIIKNLIYDLKPKIAVQMLPGLPAYILFMCVRHTDYINDDEKVQSLLNNTIHGVKRLIKKRHEELDYTVLWLANTCRLLHNLKQYSGDKIFQIANTAKQNEQCLRNFDLSEYRQILSDVAVWIYQAVIKIMEEKVQPLIVPAVLEHEAIPGMSGNRPGMRGRSSSIARETEPTNDPQKALDMLLKELTNFYAVLNSFGVDPELVTQVFRQLYYFICAGALNNLLLRKDMCHWSKGMQIRYNLSHLEQWCRDQKMQHSEVTESLEPIVQASQLLQARKQDDDAQSVCDMCFRLNNSQIIKILNLYTPIDEFEEKVPVSFIRRIQACLKERDQKRAHIQQPGTATTLLMDTKYAFPIRFPFNPSSIQLEDIVIPEQLNICGILKKL